MLTDRQRLICLLTSVGEPDKRIARMMELSTRLVEKEKHHVATSLGIPTRLLVIWAVEHRNVLRAEIKDWESVRIGFGRWLRRVGPANGNVNIAFEVVAI